MFKNHSSGRLKLYRNGELKGAYVWETSYNSDDPRGMWGIVWDDDPGRPIPTPEFVTYTELKERAP